MNERKPVCNDCGAVLNYSELGRERVEVGSFWDEPAYDEFLFCPKCGSNSIEEIDVCSKCGEILDENAVGSVCNSCLLSKTNLINAIKVGHNNPQEIEVNGFFTYCFTSEEINQILNNHIQNNRHIFTDKIYDYCAENIEELSEIIAR